MPDLTAPTGAPFRPLSVVKDAEEETVDMAAVVQTVRRAAGLLGDEGAQSAIADWLDEAADHLEETGEVFGPESVCPTSKEGLECSVLGQAVKVAEAILAEHAAAASTVQTAPEAPAISAEQDKSKQDAAVDEALVVALYDMVMMASDAHEMVDFIRGSLWLRKMLSVAWLDGANTAVEPINTGTRMTLRARIPFPADENPYDGPNQTSTETSAENGPETGEATPRD